LQLVVDYKAGTPTTQLTLKYGLSKGSVLDLLERAEVKMRRQGLDQRQAEAAVRLYETGLSLARVTKALGGAGSSSSVARALRARGIPLRGRHERI
jgi:hypothetical protein